MLSHHMPIHFGVCSKYFAADFTAEFAWLHGFKRFLRDRGRFMVMFRGFLFLFHKSYTSSFSELANLIKICCWYVTVTRRKKEKVRMVVVVFHSWGRRRCQVRLKLRSWDSTWFLARVVLLLVVGVRNRMVAVGVVVLVRGFSLRRSRLCEDPSDEDQDAAD